jgi:hypothetical protein
MKRWMIEGAPEQVGREPLIFDTRVAAEIACVKLANAGPGRPEVVEVFAGVLDVLQADQ